MKELKITTLHGFLALQRAKTSRKVLNFNCPVELGEES